MRVPLCGSNTRLTLTLRQAYFLFDALQRGVFPHFFHSPQNAICPLSVKKKLTSQREEKLLSGRIKQAGFFFLFQFLGFTNTCHVNEVGAISVVPGAQIVLEKLHVKERQKDNIFVGKFKAVQQQVHCDSEPKRTALSVCICIHIFYCMSLFCWRGLLFNQRYTVSQHCVQT